MGGAERTCVHFLNHVRSVEPVLLSHKPAGSLASELQADVKVITFCAPLGQTASAFRVVLRRSAALKWVASPCLQAHALLRQARHVARVARQERADVIVSFEDHVLKGGFGSVILEELAELGISTPVVRIGWPDEFVDHGKPDALRERYGVSVAAAKEKLAPYLARIKGAGRKLQPTAA